jgi:hypothetical protein
MQSASRLRQLPEKPSNASGIMYLARLLVLLRCLTRTLPLSLCYCCCGQLREELSNARGINDLTADETTKLLLDNSRLQQAVVAARSELLHKDEMYRLLQGEIK